MYCYIHVPFCESRCKYCRFSTFVENDEKKKQFYVDYLVKSIEDYKGQLKPLKSVYFGGGTPTSLSNMQLLTIIEALKKKFSFSENIEITLETTPNNINIENLEAWFNMGVNRLSLGIQTLNELALKEIGRIDKNGILEKLDIIKNYLSSGNGFSINKKVNTKFFLDEANANNNFYDSESIPEGQQGRLNMSLDFIIGLPYVKKGEILENLKFILDKYSFVKHISLYMLEDYYDYPESWQELGIKEDEFLEEYISCKNYLEEKGFNRYELSNFAQQGFQCKHNSAYWNHSEIYAFGLSAHGYIKNYRYSYPNNFKSYYTGKFEYIEKLSENDIFLEKLMFGLRTNGLVEDIYKKLDQKKLNEFIDSKMLEFNNKKLILSDNGVVLLDYILKEIVE